MKKIFAVALSVALVGITPTFASAAKPCSPGMTTIKSGTLYKCKKKGKKTVWVKKGQCDKNYSSPCIPVTTRDLDCADVNGPVYVVQKGIDPHGFDADQNGKGCE